MTANAECLPRPRRCAAPWWSSISISNGKAASRCSTRRCRWRQDGSSGSTSTPGDEEAHGRQRRVSSAHVPGRCLRNELRDPSRAPLALRLRMSRGNARGEGALVVCVTVTRRSTMPAKSAAQQKAAGAALSAKRGKTSPSKLKGASRGMYKSMSEKQLDEFASTKRKGKPEHVSKSRTKKPASRSTARKSPTRKAPSRRRSSR